MEIALLAQLGNRHAMTSPLRTDWLTVPPSAGIWGLKQRPCPVPMYGVPNLALGGGIEIPRLDLHVYKPLFLRCV